MTYFLFINGHVCVMNEKHAADLTVDFVTGRITFEETVGIIGKIRILSKTSEPRVKRVSFLYVDINHVVEL